MEILISLAVGALVVLVWRALANRPARAAAGAGQIAVQPATDDIYALARQLYDAYQSTAHPSDVLRNEAFAGAARTLAVSQYTNQELIRYAVGADAVLASLALEALAMRDNPSEIRALLLQNVNGVMAPWTRYFALRALHALTPLPAPLVLELLANLDDSWTENMFDRFTPQFVKELVQLRLRDGERPEASADLDAKGTENIHRALKILEPRTAASLGSVLEQTTGTRVDVSWLESVGKVWKEEDLSTAGIVQHAALIAAAAEVERTITGDRRRPVMLVGESGVGKSVLVRVIGSRMHERGWTVFEAGFAELLAGQIYIGQFEQRIQTLVRQLRRRRVVWVVSDLPSLLFAGRHQHSPIGALDTLLPHLESGEIVLIGTAEPAAYEKLLMEKPRVGTTFQAFRLRELGRDQTLDLARRWTELRRLDPGSPLLTAEILDEAWQLTQQYLGVKASPGNLLDLLKITRDRMQAVPAGRKTIDLEELITTLASLTGLPESILDERQGLDLDALRRHFSERVLGQPEAVDALVERVAMMKAGLTDPKRPLGVFLFAGPTGTGKTEIAKALADFLFGSSNRMIRIDMSELQTAESVSRLLGDPDAAVTGGSLVERIRRQPFSIVLLDEFEKAHPNVLDLFLQLFDDGRLTDRRGATADFRHALIILTSNVGAAIQTFGRMGFSNEAVAFSPLTVRGALERQFRKELLNRIDRIVIFRPLARETMRRILKKELDDLYERRGVRNRPWAVEWDGSAIDFLLEKGFTADFGARSLKRAIDQHVLSPLAVSIVNRSLPTGEQFLYVRSDGEKLAIDFIDADPADEVTSAEAPVSHGRTLQEILLDPYGSVEEMVLLESVYDELRRRVHAEDWRQKKEIDLSMTSLPEFWQSADRFAILTKAEYRDRIEAGIETAESLLTRLRRQTTRIVLARLAQQLFLLDTAIRALDADLPWEAFLHIDAGDRGEELAEMMRGMYRAWAKRRGMHLAPLIDDSREQLLSVSGYGAYSLLLAEHGVHVLEKPQGAAFERVQVRVRVAPQPVQPLPRNPAAACSQALDTVRRSGDSTLQVVRRYRQLPSPLVRDAVRNWRTGRLDLVLEGNFDVMAGRD